MQPTIKIIGMEEYLILFKQGSGMESVDSTIIQMRTQDGGKTWQNEGSLVPAYDLEKKDFHLDKPVYSYFCPHLTRLKNSCLILLTVRFRRDDLSRRCYNSVTGGCLQPDTTLFFSSDNGQSWNGPKIVDIQNRYAYSGGPVVELADESLMIVMETWKDFDDPKPGSTHVFSLFSKDLGKTWESETVVFSDPAGNLLLWDMVFKRFSDNMVGTFAWTHDAKSGKDLVHHRIFSADEGKTWSKPEPTNRQGQFNVTLELPDSSLLGVYNLRNTPNPGIYASLSLDQGRTWDLENQITIWDTSGSSRSDADSNANFLEDLVTFAFGKSDMDLLNDHEAIIVFWATKSCTTQICWAKVKW